MPTYYIALSITPPPSPRDDDVIHLLRRAIESARCIDIEISDIGMIVEFSAVGMVVECEEPSITVLEEAIRGELVAHGGSFDSISIQRI